MAACMWTHPGTNPDRSGIAQALSGFSIPAEDRDIIALKMLRAEPDEPFVIRKYSVESRSYVFDDMMVMRFGLTGLCWGVDRSRWSDNHEEWGALYCSGEYCVGIPAVCGNKTRLFGRKPRERPPTPDLAPPTRWVVPPEVSHGTTHPERSPWWWGIFPELRPTVNGHHEVPEPSGPLAIIAALFAAVVARRRK